MESKHIIYIFTHDTDSSLCNEIYISTNDATAAGGYSGDGSIESYEAFFTTEEIAYEKAVDRPRRRGHS